MSSTWLLGNQPLDMLRRPLIIVKMLLVTSYDGNNSFNVSVSFLGNVLVSVLFKSHGNDIFSYVIGNSASRATGKLAPNGLTTPLLK